MGGDCWERNEFRNDGSATGSIGPEGMVEGSEEGEYEIRVRNHRVIVVQDLGDSIGPLPDFGNVMEKF